jgi:hypothetical protein
VWAWDCEINEPVLIFPVVLALLGDNPMQSEFACHIGMRGKMFCRACWVKGADALAEPVLAERNNDQGESDVDSARSSDASGNVSRGEESEGPASEQECNQQSTSTTASALPKKKGKFVESLGSMISRVMLFMKVCFTVLCYLSFPN